MKIKKSDIVDIIKEVISEKEDDGTELPGDHFDSDSARVFFNAEDAQWAVDSYKSDDAWEISVVPSVFGSKRVSHKRANRDAVVKAAAPYIKKLLSKIKAKTIILVGAKGSWIAGKSNVIPGYKATGKNRKNIIMSKG